MRKITFLVMIILSCLACSDGKSEYIQSVSHVNSLINEYRKEYNQISTEMTNIALEDFSKIDSYRNNNQSKILKLEKKASTVVSEIDKLLSAKYKSVKLNKLFQDTRQDIMESLYNTKYEINRSSYAEREYTITTNQLKYMQQYDIEFRSLVAN